MTEKEQLLHYMNLYGNIVFPEKEGGQSETRQEIYSNPAAWMYSMDGIRWRSVPMDIGKINYAKAYFRRIPKGISIGVSNDVKTNPGLYFYSDDNGHSWHKLTVEGFPSGHVWIYHGDHSSTWFRKNTE